MIEQRSECAISQVYFDVVVEARGVISIDATHIGNMSDEPYVVKCCGWQMCASKQRKNELAFDCSKDSLHRLIAGPYACHKHIGVNSVA